MNPYTAGLYAKMKNSDGSLIHPIGSGECALDEINPPKVHVLDDVKIKEYKELETKISNDLEARFTMEHKKLVERVEKIKHRELS